MADGALLIRPAFYLCYNIVLFGFEGLAGLLEAGLGFGGERRVVQVERVQGGDEGFHDDEVEEPFVVGGDDVPGGVGRRRTTDR